MHLAARFALALIVGAVVAGGFAAAPPAVLACTGQPIPPTDKSLRYVVGGWIRSVSYEEQHPINALEPIPMTYQFEVDRSWRGAPPPTLTIVDVGSATGDTDDVHWGAMCGAMSEDPTDRYFLIGIPQEERDFSAFNLYGIGDGPKDPSLERGLEFIASHLGVVPSDAGNAGLTRPPSGSHVLGLALVGLSATLLIGGRWLTRPEGTPVDREQHPR